MPDLPDPRSALLLFMKFHSCLILLVFAWCPVSRAQVIPIAVGNASFEEPVAGIPPGYTELRGDPPETYGQWEQFGGFAAMYDMASYGGRPANATGIQALTLNGGSCFVFQDIADYDGGGSAEQYWQEGYAYTLTVALGLRGDNIPPKGSKFDLRLYQRAGDQGSAQILASRTVTVGTDAVNATSSGPLTDYSVTYTVAPGSLEVGLPIGVWLYAYDGGGDWAADNVRLIAIASEDSDSDGLKDSWEIRYFSLPGEDPGVALATILARQNAAGDPDGDGLNNSEEFLSLTDPTREDTDNDGLSDKAESEAGTNPLDPDTDDDGLADGVETKTGLFVSAANTGTDPLNPDSDNDLSSDGEEVLRRTNPNDATSFPAMEPLLLARWTLNGADASLAAAAPDPVYNGLFGNLLGAEPSPAWAPAIGDGGSLLLSVNADHVKVPSVNLAYGFSFMGWIKPDSGQSPWARFLCSERFQTGFFLGREADTRRWKLIINGNFDLPGGGTVEADRWQHVGVTYDGGEATLLLNGVAVSTGGLPAPSVPIQPLFFGSESPVDRSFTGAWDDIKYYTGALSEEEVAAIYAQESPAHANPALTLRVVSFTQSPGTGAFTLAWESDPDGLTTYRLAGSTDLTSWDEEIEAAIPSQGPITFHTFDNPLPEAKRVYFRVEANP